MPPGSNKWRGGGGNCRRGGNGEDGSFPVEDDTVFEQLDQFIVGQGNKRASIFLCFERQ